MLSKLNDMFTNSRAVTASCIGAGPWTALNNTHCIWNEFLNKYKHREIFLLHICLLRLRSIFSGRMCHLTIFFTSRVRANTELISRRMVANQMCRLSIDGRNQEEEKKTREKIESTHISSYLFSRERLKFSKRNSTLIQEMSAQMWRSRQKEEETILCWKRNENKS